MTRAGGTFVVDIRSPFAGARDLGQGGRRAARHNAAVRAASRQPATPAWPLVDVRQSRPLLGDRLDRVGQTRGADRQRCLQDNRLCLGAYDLGAAAAHVADLRRPPSHRPTRRDRSVRPRARRRSRASPGRALAIAAQVVRVGGIAHGGGGDESTILRAAQSRARWPVVRRRRLRAPYARGRWLRRRRRLRPARPAPSLRRAVDAAVAHAPRQHMNGIGAYIDRGGRLIHGPSPYDSSGVTALRRARVRGAGLAPFSVALPAIAANSSAACSGVGAAGGTGGAAGAQACGLSGGEALRAAPASPRPVRGWIVGRLPDLRLWYKRRAPSRHAAWPSSHGWGYDSRAWSFSEPPAGAFYMARVLKSIHRYGVGLIAFAAVERRRCACGAGPNTEYAACRLRLPPSSAASWPAASYRRRRRMDDALVAKVLHRCDRRPAVRPPVPERHHCDMFGAHAEHQNIFLAVPAP